jgi:hypothetical protein
VLFIRLGQLVVPKFYRKWGKSPDLIHLLRKANPILPQQVNQFYKVVTPTIRNPPEGEDGFEHLLHGLLGMKADRLVGRIGIGHKDVQRQFVLRRFAKEKLCKFK